MTFKSNIINNKIAFGISQMKIATLYMNLITNNDNSSLIKYCI